MLRTEEKMSRWLGMDMRARWRRRVAVVVTYLALIAAIAASQGDWWGHPLLAMVVLVLLVMVSGVFGNFGPVKSFEEPGVRVGARVMVNGLDEWARYRFAAPSFEEATEEQQAELLRTYRFGSYLLPARPYTYLDERETRERDGAVRWAMRWVATFVAVAAGRYAVARHPVSGMDVAADFTMIWVLVVTLPQARVLWTEADPREMNGEMELVGREA